MGDRGDGEIAHDAARNLACRPTVPKTVQAVVHNGHLTLTGQVRTLFQRVIAERAVRHIEGVKDVVNHIAVTRARLAPDLAQQNRAAFRRDPTIGKWGIAVTVDGDAVVLRGSVPSWTAREAAENAAMHAPGVATMHNEIAVVQPEPDNVDEDIC
jgi:osmotically-inducible protein OsmY